MHQFLTWREIENLSNSELKDYARSVGVSTHQERDNILETLQDENKVFSPKVFLFFAGKSFFCWLKDKKKTERKRSFRNFNVFFFLIGILDQTHTGATSTGFSPNFLTMENNLKSNRSFFVFAKKK